MDSLVQYSAAPRSASHAFAPFLEAVPVATLLLEPVGLDLVAGNSEAAAILAAPQDGLLPAWQEALAMPPHGPALRQRLEAVTSRTVPEVFDAVFHRPGRRPRDLLVRARHIVLGGRGLLSAGLVDITRRRRAEMELAAANARLEVALRGADLGSWQWDARTGVLEVSARWAAMLGLELPATGLRVRDWEAMVHPEDLPATRAALNAHLAGASDSYEAEFRMRHRDGHWVRILARGRTMERRADGRSIVVIGTHLDITARHAAELARAASEREARRRLAELETIYRTAPLGLGQLDREFRFVRVNEALAEMNGWPVEAHIGRSVWDMLPAFRPAAEPLLRRVMETGEAVTDVELSGETPKAPGVQRHWVEQFYPVRDPVTAEVIGVGIVCEEVTERKQAEQARELLLRELDHRVKNLFAVISGLVTFTARDAGTPQEMRARLLGRIGALARGHDLVRPALTGGAVEQAGSMLVQLLEALLEPFRSANGQPERLCLAGPPVPLGRTGGPPLALILHELATNAARHGALSRCGGRISVAWSVLPLEEAPEGAGACLSLRWQERGGPAASRPCSAGFGHRLVVQSCTQLGGTARFDWAPEGLTVELRLPLERLAR
ncbi:MAG: PAS domain-containing protein [Acetobacteraceae bacterium]|nr:PAS domain-containing protein [Acetobacteraceae bacterium]